MRKPPPEGSPRWQRPPSWDDLIVNVRGVLPEDVALHQTACADPQCPCWGLGVGKVKLPKPPAAPKRKAKVKTRPGPKPTTQILFDPPAPSRIKRRKTPRGVRYHKKQACPRCGTLLTPREIIAAWRSMNACKQTPHAGPGRKGIPTPCPKCGEMQTSAVKARAHCQVKRGKRWGRYRNKGQKRARR